MTCLFVTWKLVVVVLSTMAPCNCEAVGRSSMMREEERDGVNSKLMFLPISTS